MVVGKHNYNDDAGASISMGTGIGKSDIAKAVDLDLNYANYDTYHLGYSVSAGFRLNRWAFGISGSHYFKQYQIDEENEKGEVIRILEKFRSQTKRASIYSAYTFSIAPNWDSQTLAIVLSPVDKIEFYSVPSGESPRYDKRNIKLSYNLNFRVLTLYGAVDFTGYDGDGFNHSGYQFGGGLRVNGLFVGLAFRQKNFEDKFIENSISLYFDYCFNVL